MRDCPSWSLGFLEMLPLDMPAGLAMEPQTSPSGLPVDEAQLAGPRTPGELWSMDFMHDTLYHGKRFRPLNVFDEGVREALAIEVDT